ncbi:MAG: hypothetical protein K9M56_07590 [Victivallales bacterium]|nr:hypothetical protein [Victivallales bacterium]
MANVDIGKKESILGLALLITGATVGAGVLGLPVQTGLSGALPSSVGILSAWAVMTLTAIVIAERFKRSENSILDYPTLFKKDFGIVGKYLAIFGYLINYYGIMVAYLCGSAAILAFLIPVNINQNIYILVFFIPTAMIAIFGLSYVVKANKLFMLILGISFLLLLALVAHRIHPKHYLYTDWSFLIPATPVILTTFLFHNIIPPICRNLNYNRRKIWTTIVLGTSLSCIIVLIWNFVSIGAIPMGGKGEGNLLYAYLNGEPATVPLAAGLHARKITTTGMIFSLCAIFTSFISVSMGLKGFIRDFVVSTFKLDNQKLNLFLTFGPSLAVAILYPSLFLDALDIAGGVGGVIIFGIFPALLLIKYSRKFTSVKAICGIILFIVLLFLIFLDLALEFNFVKVEPKIEKQYSNTAILNKN